jgi:hypothetical protein
MTLKQAIRRIGKIHGVSVFASLQSTVNEIGECRAMTLTSTKAHDQFMPVLGHIPKSLAMFGHCPTQVVFTDNVLADKRELERIFPELLKDVVPVPEYSTMEPLHLPDDWTIVPLTCTHQVNMRMNIIMNHHSETKPVITAFDLQFPVDDTTGIRGPVALIQMAYEKTVYLIQVVLSISLMMFSATNILSLSQPDSPIYC